MILIAKWLCVNVTAHKHSVGLIENQNKNTHQKVQCVIFKWMPELMCALVPIHKCSTTRIHITIIHWCVANKIRKYLIGHTIPCRQKRWHRIKVGGWFSIAKVKYNLGLHWTIAIDNFHQLLKKTNLCLHRQIYSLLFQLYSTCLV